jgi:hypothetical protein
MTPKAKRYWTGAVLPIAFGSLYPASNPCPSESATVQVCSDLAFLTTRPLDDLPFEQYPTTFGRPTHILASGVSSITANRPFVTLAGESVIRDWNE